MTARGSEGTHRQRVLLHFAREHKTVSVEVQVLAME